MSGDEAIESHYHNFDDVSLVEFAARLLDTDVYHLLRSTMLMCNGHLYELHLNAAFSDLYQGPKRLSDTYKKYIINVLMGNDVYIVDPYDDESEAMILA